MSANVSNLSGFAALHQTAVQILSEKPTSAAAQPPQVNPYGTVTQAYQTEVTSAESGSAAYSLGTITPSSASYTGTGDGVLAVAQAIKAATPVDTAQGLQEINANATASLTKALFNYFEPLLGGSTSVTQVTGGLSVSGLNADIATAVQQFTSGTDGGAFSLTLSATKTFETADGLFSSGPTSRLPTTNVQGVTIVQKQAVLALSLSQDGTVSGNFISNQLNFDQGTVTVQGVKGADATLPSRGQLFSGYNLDTTSLTPLSVVAEPSGGQETAASSFSFNENSITQFQTPASTGVSPSIEQISTDTSGALSIAATYNQNGYTVAAQSALETLTAIADAGQSKSAVLTIAIAANTTVAVGLVNGDGSSSFVYQRPNGVPGRIDLGAVNLVA